MADREHLERTIATIRLYYQSQSTWAAWASLLADEIERLWAREAQTREALSAMKRYAVFHGLLIGECVPWNSLKEVYGVDAGFSHADDEAGTG